MDLLNEIILIIFMVSFQYQKVKDDSVISPGGMDFGLFCSQLHRFFLKVLVNRINYYQKE